LIAAHCASVSSCRCTRIFAHGPTATANFLLSGIEDTP
jgi:hypothetical protein